MNSVNGTIVNESNEGYLVDALAKLPAKAVLDEKRLAALIRKHPKTVQRMIARGELPPPIDFAKHKVWLVCHILDHLENALKAAAKKAEIESIRIAKFSP